MRTRLALLIVLILIAVLLAVKTGKDVQTLLEPRMENHYAEQIF